MNETALQTPTPEDNAYYREQNDAYLRQGCLSTAQAVHATIPNSSAYDVLSTAKIYYAFVKWGS